MTRTVTRKPAAPVVTKVAATSPELKAAAKRKATLETKAAAAIAARDAIAVKPTRKSKAAEKPTRKASSGKGKVIARSKPAGHSDESVSAYFEANGMNPKTQRAKLRRAGFNAPYSLADVKRVCAA